MDERLESKLRNCGADRPYVLESVLACENYALHSEALHYGRARRIVNSHLSRSVDFESRIDFLNETNYPEVLNDCRIDPSIDRFTEKRERILELGRLYQRVEGQVYPDAPRVRNPACHRELLEIELRAFIARVEPLCAQIHCIRAVRDRCAHGVERPCR
jgi:hypothetical protein